MIFTPRHRGRPNPFCSSPCYGKNLSKRPKKEGVERRMVTRRDHPIAPPSGVISCARVTLYEKLGPGEHPCNWCGVALTWHPESRYSPNALLADHLNHDPTDDEAGNLVASCNACNGHRRRRGDSKLISSKEPTVLRGGKPTRAVERRCNICGDLILIAWADLKHPMGGRFCSPSCRMKHTQQRRRVVD